MLTTRVLSLLTSDAAMILYEEGKFSLSDPVSKYLPEFTKMSVAQESFDAAGKRTYYTVPADHPITVRDRIRESFQNVSNHFKIAVRLSDDPESGHRIEFSPWPDCIGFGVARWRQVTSQAFECLGFHFPWKRVQDPGRYVLSHDMMR